MLWSGESGSRIDFCIVFRNEITDFFLLIVLIFLYRKASKHNRHQKTEVPFPIETPCTRYLVSSSGVDLFLVLFVSANNIIMIGIHNYT